MKHSEIKYTTFWNSNILMDFQTPAISGTPQHKPIKVLQRSVNLSDVLKSPIWNIKLFSCQSERIDKDSIWLHCRN